MAIHSYFSILLPKRAPPCIRIESVCVLQGNRTNNCDIHIIVNAKMNLIHSWKLGTQKTWLYIPFQIWGRWGGRASSRLSWVWRNNKGYAMRKGGRGAGIPFTDRRRPIHTGESCFPDKFYGSKCLFHYKTSQSY